MKISFDAAKRAWTLTERQLDIADAGKLLAGTVLTLEDDQFDYPEHQFRTYGRLDGRVMLMVWTPTDDGIRVISMRNCHDKESRRIAPRLG